MKIISKVLGVFGAISLGVCASQAQDKFETLKIGEKTYTNVTVTSRTAMDVYISYQGGFENLKVATLDAEALSLLGYQEDEVSTAMPPISLARFQESPRVQEMQLQLAQRMEGTMLKMEPTMIAGLLIGAFMLYLFYCYCCLLICRRTGNEPGLLVWIPVLQAFPLLKAAGMPAWWFFMFMLPIVNIVAGVMWCIKIADACGKSVVTGIMLLLPITSFFAFLYLAFSSDKESDEELQPIRLNLSQG